MKQITELGDCVGKVVRQMATGDGNEELAIVFEDDTFIVIRAWHCGDDPELEVKTRFDPTWWQHADLENAFGFDIAREMVVQEMKDREAKKQRIKQEKKEKLLAELAELEKEQ